MIYEFPLDGANDSTADPLKETAAAASLLMDVVGALADDLDTRLQIQAETVAEAQKKAIQYLNYRLTMQRKRYLEVFDYLATNLENRLTEQQVLLNLAAPGMAEVINASGGLADSTPDGQSNVTQSPLTNGNVPVPIVLPPAGIGNSTQETADNTAANVSQPATTVEQTSSSGISSAATPINAATIVKTLPDPVTHFTELGIVQTFPNGTQVASNINLTLGELQLFPPGASTPVSIPIMLPLEAVQPLPSDAQIAVVINGVNPQTVTSQGSFNVGFQLATVQCGSSGGQVASGGNPGTGAIPGGNQLSSVQGISQGTGADQNQPSVGGIASGTGNAATAGNAGQQPYQQQTGGTTGGTYVASTGNTGQQFSPAGNDQGATGQGGGGRTQGGGGGSGQTPGIIGLPKPPGYGFGVGEGQLQCVMVYGVPCASNVLPQGVELTTAAGSGTPVDDSDDPPGYAEVQPLFQFDDPDDYDFGSE